MTPEALRRITQRAPRTPGVYRFLDVRGKPLYIGKAAHLKNRLASYARADDVRIGKMVSLAQRVTWEETGSDIEALILESRYIKKYRPKFNVLMRDDKQYSFVVFTNDIFPKIILTHQPRMVVSGTTTLGPFTEAGAVRSTLKYLRRLFPYCTCTQLHHVRCLNAHIGKCLGFCCLKNIPRRPIDVREYRANINAIKRIFSGERTSVTRALKKEMDSRAKRGDFERAITLRATIEKIERIFENAYVLRTTSSITHDPGDDAATALARALKLSTVPLSIEGYDISHIQGSYATGSMVRFHHGQPDKTGYRKFRIHTVTGINDTAMLREVLTRRFSHPEWPSPDLVLIDGGKGQLNSARAVVGRRTTVIGLTKNDAHKGEKITYRTGGAFKELPLSRLPNSAKNLVLAVDAEAHRFAIGYYRTLHRRALRKRTPRATM